MKRRCAKNRLRQIDITSVEESQFKLPVRLTEQRRTLAVEPCETSAPDGRSTGSRIEAAVGTRRFVVLSDGATPQRRGLVIVLLCLG